MSSSRRSPDGAQAATSSPPAAPSARIFRPVELPHSVLLSDLAAEQLMGLIESGDLAPGQRLPPERDLAQQLGVSRTTLREAFGILEASGILEARVGRGRFVTSRGEARGEAALAGVGDSEDWLRRNTHEVAELAHVLQIVEPVGVLEVPAHLVHDVAAKARGILRRTEAVIAEGTPEEAARLDAEFHRALCEQTPNRLLRDLIFRLIDSGVDSASAVQAVPAAAQKSFEHHTQIVSALERGARAEASDLLRQHIAIASRVARGHVLESEIDTLDIRTATKA